MIDPTEVVILAVLLAVAMLWLASVLWGGLN